MNTIIKTTTVNKDTFEAIKEAKQSTAKEGITSKGIKFIKTLTHLILL